MKSVIVLANTDRNFTPARLMDMYARECPEAHFTPGIRESVLVISGVAYRYHHWHIGDGYVVLYLQEVGA